MHSKETVNILSLTYQLNQLNQIKNGEIVKFHEFHP